MFSQTKVNAKNSVNTTGNISIVQLPNILQGITNVLFGGCVNISNLTFSGSALQIGYFVDNTGTLGIDSGLVLTTGKIDSLIGINPSTFNGNNTNWGHSWGGNGDALLSSESGNQTFDASIIEFDFSPQSDSLIGCRFLFASEEYPEYVGGSFNDIYGFFISGPGITGNQNLAVIPGTSTPISVNNINANTNSQYFNNNLGGQYLKLDGYTEPFSLNFPVTPNETYHFKIAIADVGDGIMDAAVFIKGGSFLGNEPLPYTFFTYQNVGANNAIFNNQSTGSDSYSWDFGDGQTSNLVSPTHTYSTPGAYNVRLTGSNQCYSSDRIIQVVIGETGIKNNSNDNTINYSWLNDDVLTVSSIIPGDYIIEVNSINGELLYNEKTHFNYNEPHHIELSKLIDGIYILNIHSKEKNKKIKLIKK
jgi:hypothetical protein